MKSFKDVGVEVNMSDHNSASVEEIELENVNTLRLDQTPLSTLYSLPTFSRSVQSTQLNETYTCESSIPDNNLTMADLEIIREHLEKNGKLNESKQMSLSWLSDNIAALTSLMPHSGVQLEHLIGKEYVYVKDALMALDLLSAHGTITAMELAVSEDARLLSKSHQLDRLTFHSLANVIRNILKERTE